MFVWILVFMFTGIILGTITGLIPGLHPNTIFAITVPLLPMLAGFPIQCTMVFIVSLAITNTFTDFLPSIIFGAPEPSTALSVLPAHQMLLKGRGYEALFLTVLGGLLVSILTVVLMVPLLFIIIPAIYENIHTYIHIILIGIVIWMLLVERGKNRLFALFVFFLAGFLGFITLNTVSSERVLFPALSGLFGLSGMFISLLGRTRIPPQEITDNIECDYKKGTLASWFSGLLVGILPGVGSAQAGIISSQLFRNRFREFLMTLGGINTANMFFTLIVFYTIGNIRSGTVWAISQITDTLSFNNILLIASVCIFAAFVAGMITLKLGKLAILKLDSISYGKVTFLIFLFIISMVFVISGWLGLLVLFTSFFIGSFSILLGLNRTHLMGFLILPTILYYLGMNVILLNFLGT